MDQLVMHWIAQYGYLGIFCLLMVGIVGLPVPDETLMVICGYLVFKGKLLLAPTVASAFLGSICGITISYSIGRTGGYYLIRKHGHWLHVTKEKIDRVRDWFEYAGKWGLFFGYFIPGIRHLIALVAGTSRLRYPVFAAFTYSGGLVWCSSFLTVGYFLGKEWVHIAPSVHRWMLVLVAAACGLILMYFWLIKRKTDK